MKARIKFQKYGAMKFIGHLDVMRYFQKLFRRAEIDNEYSKGFSPHQIMSFAAPLGVGLTSDGEYLDIQLLSSDTPENMVKRMNDATSEGLRIVGFQPLLDPIENQRVVTAMSLVGSADYLVSLKDGYTLEGITDLEVFKKQFTRFLEQDEIVVDKKTKKSEKAVDIKSMISLVAFDQAEYMDKLPGLLIAEEELQKTNTQAGYSLNEETVAEVYENEIKVYLQVDTGSAANLKPELVMEAFCDWLGQPFEKYSWQVHRIEVYTKQEESGKLIPLSMLER
jgi:radical SAM-linked protein